MSRTACLSSTALTLFANDAGLISLFFLLRFGAVRTSSSSSSIRLLGCFYPQLIVAVQVPLYLFRLEPLVYVFEKRFLISGLLLVELELEDLPLYRGTFL